MLSRSRSLVFLLLLVAPVAFTATGCKGKKPKPEVRLNRTLTGVENPGLAGAGNGSVPPGGLWSPDGAPGTMDAFGSGSMTSGSGSGFGAGSGAGNGITQAATDSSTGSYLNNANTSGVELGTFTSELEMIHFEYDQAEIAEAWKPVLDGHAEWLKANTNMMVQIEGHCDERGTEEYNVSLGQRRADIVREYLISKGVDANRLSTLSYGKMRPLNFDGTDEAMALNRRAMFLVYQMDGGVAATTTADATTVDTASADAARSTTTTN